MKNKGQITANMLSDKPVIFATINIRKLYSFLQQYGWVTNDLSNKQKKLYKKILGLAKRIEGSTK